MRLHLNGHSSGPKSQNYDITGGLKRPRTSDSSGKENLSQEAPPLSEGVYLFVWRVAGGGGGALITEWQLFEKIRWMKWKIIQYMVGYVTYLLFILVKVFDAA